MISLGQAINNLSPMSCAGVVDDDFTQVVWLVEEKDRPSQIEVQAEVLRLEQAAADKEAADAAARDAAIAHAKSLGFTDEMIAVMYPGLTV